MEKSNPLVPSKIGTKAVVRMERITDCSYGVANVKLVAAYNESACEYIGVHPTGFCLVTIAPTRKQGMILDGISTHYWTTACAGEEFLGLAWKDYAHEAKDTSWIVSF